MKNRLSIVLEKTLNKGIKTNTNYNKESKRMDNILTVKGVASSFVINQMKINTDTGSGEAKLFVGPMNNKNTYDEFFEFNNDYHYKFDKDNLITYLNQVKLEYAFQKINKYKNVSIELWEQNYNKIVNLNEEELTVNLEKFNDENRYYVRANNNIFKKLLRSITIPKLTNIVFEKDVLNKNIYIKLQLNLEIDADEKNASWLISINSDVYDHELNFKEQSFIEWEQNINCKVKDIIYIYITKPKGKIKYKTRVEKKDIDYSNLETQKSYWLNRKKGNKNEKYMKLVLEDLIDSEELILPKLMEHGLKSDLQSPELLNTKPKLLKYIEKAFNENTIELEDYTEEELAELLKDFYNDPNYTKNSGIQLFGIKYGPLIKLKNYNRTEILKKSGLSNSYDTELYKGMSLSKYVQMIDTDEVEYKICTKEEKINYKNFNTGYVSQYSRNRIIFGAPGTGKSYRLNNDREALLTGGNEENYERVTFHPDYSYANFVGTYKPVPCKNEDGSDGITYEYVPGPFMRIYVEAVKNSRTNNIKPYLLIIEEINRANVAAVFGDIFQLLDRDENNVSEYPIETSEDIKKYLAKKLGGRPSDYKKIYIPDNMFIWATMNSADQGVFPMDTAFKRRWEFDYLGIDEKEEGIENRYIILGNGEYRRKVEWNKLRKLINNKLSTLKVNEDKLLGPYFLSTKVIKINENGEINKDVFIPIFKGKVLMYLFEDAAKQRRKSLFASDDDNIKYSSICKKFDEKGVYVFDNDISKEFDHDIVEEDN